MIMIMIIIMIIIITHYLQTLFSWLLLFMFLSKGSRVEKSKKQQQLEMIG